MVGGAAHCAATDVGAAKPIATAAATRSILILFMIVPPRQRQVEWNRNKGAGQDGQHAVG
jgi:hypothetical protein